MGWSLCLERCSPLYLPGDLLLILQDPAQALSSMKSPPPMTSGRGSLPCSLHPGSIAPVTVLKAVAIWAPECLLLQARNPSRAALTHLGSPMGGVG